MNRLQVAGSLVETRRRRTQWRLRVAAAADLILLIGLLVLVGMVLQG